MTPPTHRFLGTSAAAPGPFALLGLAPDACTDDHVLAALERQLQRIDMHPEGDTPEADEVRLALHAAAAQLLDFAVRQQLIVRWRDGGPAAPHTPHAPGPATPATRAGLEQDAILTMAQYGGWNQESLRRLALLASARGLPSNAVADTLRHLSKRGGAPALHTAAAPPTSNAPPRPPSALTAPAPMAPPPPPAPRFAASAGEDPAPAASSHSREMKIVAAALAVGAIALITLLGIIIIATSKKVTPQQAASATSPAPAPAAPTTPAPPQPTPPPQPPNNPAALPESAAIRQFADVHEAIRALRAAAEQARTQPDEATATFSAAIEWLGGWWCRLEVGQLRAANDATVEFIYAVAKWPDAAASAVDALAAGAQPLTAGVQGASAADVWPAAWSTGMLVRLTRERDLPAELAARIERALTATLGADRPRADASFTAGAAAALARLPLKLIAGAEDIVIRPGPALGKDAAPDSAEPALRRWSEAVTAVLDDAAAQERVLVEGLEQIMVASAEPDASRRVFEAIGFFAVEIRWRRAGAARARLVDWFRDPRISSGDLNVLTNAMATGSSAEGVGPSMVLPWSGAPHDRERLRAEYAAAWGIAEAAAGDAAAQTWADAVDAALQRTSRVSSPMTDLAGAAELALLHQAARHIWRGESAQAEVLITEAARAAERAQTSLGEGDRSGPILRPGSSTDGQWALAFLSANQNRQLRLERLAELEQLAMVGGPADAEVLVDAACFGSPIEVRAAAQRIVFRLSREPVVVNAMLEILPKAPKIESVSTMIEVIGGQALPRPSDPDWMLAARRSLVERLAELLAAGNDGLGAYDRVADLLRSAYGAPDAAAQGEVPGPDGPAPEMSVLWRAWRAEAESFAPNPHAPTPLDKIVGRRAGRAALGLGPVQAWAAGQAGLAELLAYIVSGESPSRAPRVQEVMADLAVQRRAAAHIFEQLRVTEGAMLRLWLLRFGKDSAWSGG